MITIAEMILGSFLAVAIYFCLAPVRRRLEKFFARIFNNGRSTRERVVIDIDRKNKDN